DNVFQGVTGFASLALDQLPPNTPAHQNVREADSAARHGMKFCAQLHQLSRGGQAKPLPAGGSHALARGGAPLVNTAPDGPIASEVAADLPAVAIEGGGLQMILGHLRDNAVEASPKDGLVQLTARLVELAPADLAGFHGHPATGPHVEVRIADSGPGLPDEARRRVVVGPFFTTKFRHPGLSLAVGYRILYAHPPPGP